MISFLNGFGALCVAALAVSIGAGYVTPEAVDLNTHVLVGLSAALLSILCLSLVMFYFIGTGSVAKKAARRNLIEPEEYRATRKMKGVLFPIVMGAIAVLMVTPALGAAYHAGKLELGWHHGLAWLSLVVTFLSLGKARGMMRVNIGVFDKSVKAVNDDAERRHAAGESVDDL
jgi:hypothetical protein